MCMLHTKQQKPVCLYLVLRFLIQILAPPHPPRRGRCTQGGGRTAAAASAPVEPPARSCPARCRPTVERWRPGRHTRSGPFGGQPGEDRGAKQGLGGSPPPSPASPAALTRWQPTGPRPTPAAAQQPPRHEYTPGGRPETTDGRPTPDGAGGRGTAPPPPPPRRLPPPA